MDFFTSMEVSASGLTAERHRMNTASSNLANVDTTKGADGGPYRRRDVVLQAQAVSGAVAGSGAADGYVAYPNVSAVSEMVDMITASRAYEAGVTALTTAVTMAERALSIGK